MSEDPKPKVLVIDDEGDIRHLLTITLLQMNLDVVSAKDVKEAMQCLSEQQFTFCLTDLKLPDGNGLDLVKHCKEFFPDMPIAVITAFGNTDIAVEAMKIGAFDFLAKPIDLAHLRQLLKHAFKFNKKTADDSKEHDLIFLIGNSSLALQLKAKLKKLKGSQAPVVIEGEKGTCKELLAKHIHLQSSRNDHHEIYLDCANHNKSDVGFNLFTNKKENQLLAAHQSTLVISNIHLLSNEYQKQLLKLLEEKQIYLANESRDLPVDIRVIVCTHKPLLNFVSSGQLREDLYFRLNIAYLKIPNLSERREDINQIANGFVKQFSNKKTLSNAAKQHLTLHEFAYNYRELENIIEKTCEFCELETIDVNDLQLDSQQEQELSSLSKIGSPSLDRGDMPLDQFIENIEKVEITKALEKTRWNRTEAAKLLGISFRTIRYKMKKLDIE